MNMKAGTFITHDSVCAQSVPALCTCLKKSEITELMGNITLRAA